VRLTGTVVWVPRPGNIGIGVDLELPVGGFVDALHLPHDLKRWPTVGTVTDFAIWWMDERPQIRLMPADPGYRREDFTTWLADQDTVAATAFRDHMGPNLVRDHQHRDHHKGQTRS
jgi:hypothetical protein